MKNILKKLVLITVLIAAIFTLSACGKNAENLYGTWYEENGYLKLDIDAENITVHDHVFSIDDPVIASFDYKVSGNMLSMIGNNGDKIPFTLVYDDDKNLVEIHYAVEDKEIVLTQKEVALVPFGENLISVMSWLKAASEGNPPELNDEEQALVVDAQTMLSAYDVIKHLFTTLDFEWTGTR